MAIQNINVQPIQYGQNLQYSHNSYYNQNNQVYEYRA
jgi:hypothetical protein